LSPEREGSDVNHADRLQSFSWAIRPPVGVQVEGQLYWRLLGRRGLYRPQEILNEIAQQTLFFAPAMGDVPDVGVDLKVTLLA
jgi:NADH-quinone oxidoreductase subunit G